MLMSIILSVSSLAWVGYPETGYEETHQMVIIREKDTGNIYAVRCSTESLDENYIYLFVTSNNEIEAKFVESVRIATRGSKWLLDTQQWGEEENRSFYFDEILQSNCNVYSDIDKTSVFFSLPKLILPPVLTQHPPLSLMSPQIVGLLPFLIGLLIALVAFWKAWQFLLRTLRKA